MFQLPGQTWHPNFLPMWRGLHPCGSKWTTPQRWWLEFSNQICASFGTLSLVLLYAHPVLAMSPSDAFLPNDECLRTRSCVLPVSWPTRHRPSGICFSGLKLIQSWGVLTSILLNDDLLSIPNGKTKQQFNTQKTYDAVFNKAHSSKNNETNIFSALCIAINQWIFQWTFWASNLQGIQDVFSFWPRHPQETTRMRRCTKCDHVHLHCWELIYPIPGGTFELFEPMIFPFPKEGYVSSLEGNPCGNRKYKQDSQVGVSWCHTVGTDRLASIILLTALSNPCR